MKKLDSGFRQNDDNSEVPTFYETIRDQGLTCRHFPPSPVFMQEHTGLGGTPLIIPDKHMPNVDTLKVQKHVTPAKAGVQNPFIVLDSSMARSGIYRNDNKSEFQTFYEIINHGGFGSSYKERKIKPFKQELI